MVFVAPITRLIMNQFGETREIVKLSIKGVISGRGEDMISHVGNNVGTGYHEH